MIALRFALPAIFLFPVACGGQASEARSGAPPTDASLATQDGGGLTTVSNDAAAPDDASHGGSSDDAPNLLVYDANPPPYDAGPPCQVVDASLAGRVPVNHRPSGAACPTSRGGGDGADPACNYGDAGPGCTTDSDCTAGENGRCLAYSFPPGACATPGCSYDDCESDSDCPSGQACDCRVNGGDTAPNVCAAGGNCKTDSDCGPGGYCSPGAFDGFACTDPVFFCHSSADTCIDDTDCCPPTAGCLFDGDAGHFACSYACVPPP
jgi:hypothetical protein